MIGCDEASQVETASLMRGGAVGESDEPLHGTRQAKGMPSPPHTPAAPMNTSSQASNKIMSELESIVRGEDGYNGTVRPRGLCAVA